MRRRDPRAQRQAAVLTAALLVALTLFGCGARRERWNVLIVTFDTTRADHIGCYGYPSARTPTIDALAADGVRFEQAYTPVPITAPSHSTIFTGLLPLAHGVRDNGMFVLPARQQTLAEILKAEGYATGAAIGSFPLTAQFGLDQGFDFYDDHVNHESETLQGLEIPRRRLFFDERPADWVNEALDPWLAENHQRPFLLWAHYFDPHQPYAPPEPYDALFSTRPYDGEIAFADESFGALLDRLRELGVYDRTLIVFTADHGEGLGEHDEATHAIQVYSSTTHVPLVIRMPGNADGEGGRAARGAAVGEPVGTVDLLPTILDVLGIEIPANLQGRSLAPQLRGEPISNGRSPQESSSLPIYMETLAARLGHNWGELRALFDGRYKFIHGPRPELYDLRADPRELTDLIEREPEIADRLQRQLASFMRSHAVAAGDAAVGMDEQVRQRLMALGYLHSGDPTAVAISEELTSGGIAPQDRVGSISRWSRVRQLLHGNQPLQARETLKPLLAADPENSTYLELLGVAEVMLGHTEAAEAAFEKLLAAHGGGNADLQGRVLRELGRLRLQLGELERSLELTHHADSVDPQPESRYTAALLLRELGRGDEAFAALERTLELDPGFAPARTDLAVAQIARGLETEAEENFRRALHDRPYFARGFLNYATFLAERHGFEPALPYYERAVVLDRAYWRARLTLVEAYLHLDREADAIAQLEILEQRVPGSSAATLGRQLVDGR